VLEPRAAAQRIVDALTPVAVVTLPLEQVDGLVLATDIVSPIAMPRWTNSAMDGFACRSDDVIHAGADTPATLRIVGRVRAGEQTSVTVGAGEAMRISTGAPIPAGADTVVRVEDTTVDADQVHIRDARDAGRNVRPAGEDVTLGETVLTAGTRLSAARISLLASIGAQHVAVHRRVRVGVVATGDELIALADFSVERGDRIVSSNSYGLLSALREMGAEAVDFGIARDDPAELRRVLAAAAADCDLVLTTAGVSVGEHDHVKRVVEELGGALDFWRVRMRPGSPLAAGRIGNTPWLGLPGNPVSTLVTFELFGRPAVRRLAGARSVFPATVPVVLDDAVSINGALTHYLRALVDIGDDGRLHARLAGAQASNIVSSLARANALLIVPPDRPRIAAGELLHALPTGDRPFLSTHP
jgi:molybdopterin molybdotransferase